MTADVAKFHYSSFSVNSIHQKQIAFDVAFAILAILTVQLMVRIGNWHARTTRQQIKNLLQIALNGYAKLSRSLQPKQGFLKTP